MAIVKIIKKVFEQDNGEFTPYERLAIIGSIDGEVHTLEVKLPSKADYLLAKLLLESTESAERETIQRKTSENEKKEFDRGTKKTILDDDEDEESEGLFS